jgi:hypothetical protein
LPLKDGVPSPRHALQPFFRRFPACGLDAQAHALLFWQVHRLQWLKDAVAIDRFDLAHGKTSDHTRCDFPLPFYQSCCPSASGADGPGRGLRPNTRREWLWRRWSRGRAGSRGGAGKGAIQGFREES